MSAVFSLQNVDWNALSDSMTLSKKDLEKMGKVIVRRITRRIMKQETADGRPLDQNSIGWQAQKLRLGKPTLPLQFQGGIRNPDFYTVKIVNEDIIRIQMIDSYRDIHLSLIDISEETGKNYRDWFGIHEDDIIIIKNAIREIIHDKFVAFFGVYIING